MTPVPVHVVAEVVDESRLHFRDERVQLQVGGGAVNLKGRGEVEGAVGEVEMAGIDPAEAEMKGGGSEWRGRKVNVGGCWSEGGRVEEDRREVW